MKNMTVVAATLRNDPGDGPYYLVVAPAVEFLDDDDLARQEVNALKAVEPGLQVTDWEDSYAVDEDGAELYFYSYPAVMVDVEAGA